MRFKVEFDGIGWHVYKEVEFIDHVWYGKPIYSKRWVNINAHFTSKEDALAAVELLSQSPIIIEK